MNTYSKQIIEILEQNLVDFDLRVEESSVNRAKQVAEDIKQAKLEFSSLKHNAFAYYDKMFSAAGGKGNYHLMCNGFSQYVEETIRKSEQSKVAKRNIKISKKLVDCGITEILSANVVLSDYGFNGYFDVTCSTGTKRVCIDTILAGGDVQCLHHRVLVKIK